MAGNIEDAFLDDVWFVYDGMCPVCQIGAARFRVRKSVGALHTVDARTQKDHQVMCEVNEAGLNLNDGMVIKYQGQLHQGAAALHVMAQLGENADWFNRSNNLLFQNQAVAKFCYPSMKSARNIALALKGAGKIRNLDRADE